MIRRGGGAAHRRGWVGAFNLAQMGGGVILIYSVNEDNARVACFPSHSHYLIKYLFSIFLLP